MDNIYEIPRIKVNGVEHTVKAVECKNVSFIKAQDGSDDDMHYIKGYATLDNGDVVPFFKGVENFKRPFWMVRKPYRHYKEKKEWEDIKKLEMFMSTQSQLTKSIVRAQGYGNPDQSLNRLARNPYLYGADVSGRAIIKRGFQQKYPDAVSNNSVAVLDLESSMEDERILLCTATFKDKGFIGINTTWLTDKVGVEQRVHDLLLKHLPEAIKDHNFDPVIFYSDKPHELIIECFKHLHEWGPDFLTFWNMEYDVPKMEDTLKAAGIDPADVFCDPIVPKKYRYFHWKEGSKVKIKANGKPENKSNYDKWNVVTCPCKFTFIDLMCVTRIMTRAAGKMPSYKLDYQLNRVLKRGKLYMCTLPSKIKDGSPEWHSFMQREHKYEYIIYNIFDCIGLEMYDAKTTYLITQIGVLLGSAEYDIFDSNPKNTTTDLHFYCLEKGLVLGTCSDQMEIDLDKLVQGKSDWIVALPAHNVVDNGICMFSDNPFIRSLIRLYVADADLTSTYPNGEIVLNLSKQTTMMELCRIQGQNDLSQRYIGINMTGGASNAIEIMRMVCGAPTMYAVREEYRKRKNMVR